jgi:hypothetical protein
MLDDIQSKLVLSDTLQILKSIIIGIKKNKNNTLNTHILPLIVDLTLIMEIFSTLLSSTGTYCNTSF